MNRENLRPQEHAPKPSTYLPPMPLESFVEATKERLPGFFPISIVLPKAGETLFSIYGGFPHGIIGALFGYFSTEVQFEAATGRILEVSDQRHIPVATRLDLLVYPVHTTRHEASGLIVWIVKVFYALGGLAPSVLSISGFLLWKMKQRQPRRLQQTLLQEQ